MIEHDRVKYEILTEDKNNTVNGLIEKCITGYFQSFSIQKQIGYYYNVRENSQTIIIITIAGDRTRGLIYELAERIKTLGNQEAILVIETKVKTTTIT